MSLLAFSISSLSPIQTGVICGVCLVAAITDIAVRRIPNLLTLPMLATGLAWSAWQRGPLGFLDALIASILLALPYVMLFVFAKGGGGDIKLMAAIGAWTGIVAGLFVLMLVALSGVVMGLGYALFRGQFRATIGRTAKITNQAMPAIAMRSASLLGQLNTMDRKEMQPMPYGIAIFAGVCFAVGGLALWHG